MVVTVVSVVVEDHVAPAVRGQVIVWGGASVIVIETLAVPDGVDVEKLKAAWTRDRSDTRNHVSPAIEYVRLPCVTFSQSFVSYVGYVTPPTVTFAWPATIILSVPEAVPPEGELMFCNEYAHQSPFCHVGFPVSARALGRKGRANAPRTTNEAKTTIAGRTNTRRTTFSPSRSWAGGTI